MDLAIKNITSMLDSRSETKPKANSLKPFNSIALCLSGGGYRAAAFALGSLSYLEHLKLPNDTTRSLLDNIRFISSTSGGSITNGYYSLHKKKGIPFKDIYNGLINLLTGDQILNQALDILNDDRAWKEEGKKRNIINSFAKVYDKLIFKGATMECFWDHRFCPEHEVCFNSTEFSTGITFRIQTDGRDETFEKTGNNYIYFKNDKKEILKKIKLADVLAASSCFPGGFEPIMLPDDFTYSTPQTSLTREELVEALVLVDYNSEQRKLKDGEMVGLMDGGITDNQAVDSAILANTRRKKNPFDLFIVTDVSSYFMDPYVTPIENKKDGWARKTINDCFKKWLGFFKKLSIVLISMIILLFVSIGLFLFSDNDIVQKVSLFLGGFSLMGSITGMVLIRISKMPRKLLKNLNEEENKYLINLLQKKVPALNNFSHEINNKLISYLRQTRLGVLVNLLNTRLNSMLSMVSDINLKHVRRLIYHAFFDKEEFHNRRCSNFIYDLSEYNLEIRNNKTKERQNWSNEEKELMQLTPGCALARIAEEAKTMGTTLWFDSNDQQNEKLKKVITSGQFTLCANLLEYTIKLQRDHTLIMNTEDQTLVQNIRELLEKDWKHFLNNPYYLYDRLQ